MIFFLFTNVNGFLVHCADYTQFLRYGTIHDLDQLIKDTVETLAQCKRFYIKNGLMFNSSKTKCIFIGNRQLLSLIPLNTTTNFDGNNVIYPSKDFINFMIVIYF